MLNTCDKYARQLLTYGAFSPTVNQRTREGCVYLQPEKYDKHACAANSCRSFARWTTCAAKHELLRYHQQARVLHEIDMHTASQTTTAPTSLGPRLISQILLSCTQLSISVVSDGLFHISCHRVRILAGWRASFIHRARMLAARECAARVSPASARGRAAPSSPARCAAPTPAPPPPPSAAPQSEHGVRVLGRRPRGDPSHAQATRPGHAHGACPSHVGVAGMPDSELYPGSPDPVQVMSDPMSLSSPPLRGTCPRL